MVQSYNFPLGVTRHDPNFEKILQIIDSFRGYETLEDLKASDELVRQLRKAADESVGARRKIDADMYLRALPDFDSMVKHIHADTDILRDHLKKKIEACQVYRPKEDYIRELYIMDFKMLSDAENVYNLMQEFARIAREDLAISNIHKIDLSLGEIGENMEKRGKTIGCMIE
jgi:hypothetical protein